MKVRVVKKNDSFFPEILVWGLFWRPARKIYCDAGDEPISFMFETDAIAYAKNVKNAEPRPKPKVVWEG